jgi:predicted nuclease with TOPRIM domain
VVLQWLTRALFHRQRAFRERKERHIKELEIKIVKLEEESKSVGGENERLKKEIAQLNNYVEYASWRSKQRRL